MSMDIKYYIEYIKYNNCFYKYKFKNFSFGQLISYFFLLTISGILLNFHNKCTIIDLRKD